MSNLLLEVLRTPDVIKEFSSEDWNLFISQGYNTRMLGRCYVNFEKLQLLAHIPTPLLWHFESAFQVSLAHKVDVKLEMHYINQALKMAGIVPIYLKGAAYELTGDDAAKGRVYSDIDIYIPKHKLPAAEQVLRWKGWVQGDVDPSDEAYYRNWMHEIPPLVHSSRGTTLDVHHNLLPVIARISIDPKKLAEGISPNAEYLSAADRVLHSIVHLFMETEFDKGLRDLSDIDLLLKQHSQTDPMFWTQLSQRADYLDLGRLYFYALRYADMLLNTPIPADVLDLVRRRHGPNKVLLRCMDCLFINVFSQSQERVRKADNKLAHFMIFIRGHWLKMPLHILLYHSVTKVLREGRSTLLGKNSKKTSSDPNIP
jgi:hypothetical protein